MKSKRKYKVGLAAVYFKFFDDVMPANYRKTKEAFVQLFIDKLSPYVDVVYTELIDDDVKAVATREKFIKENVDLILLAPAMAAPPSYGANVVENIDVPIILWCVPTVQKFVDDLSQTEATKHTTLVGSIMIGNALVRAGKIFQTVNAGLDNDAECERLKRIILGACVANRLKQTRFFRLGGIIPGYIDVDVSKEQFFAGLGAELIDLDQNVVNQAYHLVSGQQIDALKQQLAQWNWQVSSLSAEMFERSAQLAVALEQITKEYNCAGGAINCHGACFRNNAEVGIVGCLGVSRLSAMGIPIACTGDVLTGTAMWIGQEIAGAALYCECYALETETNLLLLAAGGEGDPRLMAQGEQVEIRANEHYSGIHGAGAGVTFPVQTGPGTLISLSPSKNTKSGWILVWATGEIVESRYRNMGGPNAMFKFDHVDPSRACEAWISSGATHHNAFIPGRRDVELISFATALGIDQLRITN